MASSGSITVKSTKHTNIVLSWSLISQSVSQNTSEVSWKLLLVADSYGRINSSSSKAWSVTFDGQTASGTNTIGISAGETKTLASGTFVLNHNADGTKQFSYSFSQMFDGTFSDVYVGIVTGSGTDTATTISRASTPSADPGELGSAITIYTNRASNNFTHTLRYQFGSASGLIAKDVGESTQWKPDVALAEQIPNAAFGSATIICETYSGGTQIGTATKIPVTLSVPDSVAPSVTATWTDITNATSQLGNPAKTISAIKVSVSAEKAYGSDIVSTSVQFDGKVYTSNPATTQKITGSGNMSLVVTATDKRGRVGRETYIIQVLDYSVPALVLNASRCLEDGTADDTGEFAKVTIDGTVSPVGGNSGSLSLTYGYTTVDMAMSSTSGAFTSTKIIPAASTAALSLSVKLTDKIAETTRAMTLSTGYATMDFLAGGKGIAFGKSATREGFDCSMPAFFENVNGMGLGQLAFTGATAQLPGRPGPYLIAFTADSGAYGLYLASTAPAATPEALRLGGALAATMQGTATGVSLTVTGSPTGLRGWYLG